MDEEVSEMEDEQPMQEDEQPIYQNKHKDHHDINIGVAPASNDLVKKLM